ncbi:hypothetical protein J437_LFUL004348 [Ladona fulva]|uniref:Annexin n=1 Tax=Ladona fulva TaxID=123851 RepID=A0A8K0K982_LADFU|nr:hypothetical protein J437_LFUL004348 [Ladona fulva]
MEDDLKGETSGHFRRLLTVIVMEARTEWGPLDENKAKRDAEILYNAGEGMLGTDEVTFNSILGHQNPRQLRLLFREYAEVAGKTIEQTIEDEMSGSLKDALLAIVECVQCRPAYFAKRLEASMKGRGTDDRTLIRIIVSRAEIDLGNIKQEYERLFDKTLVSDIESRPDLVTAGMDFIIANPTVRPFSSFSAAEDAIALRTAMKGLGTDEDAIIEILTHRSNAQRQEIAKFFNLEYGRDLIKDLKSELGGKFEDVIIGLMYTPIDYLAKQLHKAMEGLGTDEAALVEILCTKNNREIKEIVEAYERMYDRPLAEHLCSETSGDLRRLLTFMVTGVRNEHSYDPSTAAERAQELYAAGELKLGTDEEVFNRILTHESIPQLKLIFEEYKQISGRTIEQTLQDEMSGELLDGLMAIVECIQSPACFFAKRLHKAMAGAGTDDSTLIRIIVSRCEIDLGNIKREYEKLYDKTLESVVKNETSGDYKHALVALIGGP